MHRYSRWEGLEKFTLRPLKKGLPQVTIPTPIRINGKPVTFIAGGANYGGRLVGAGFVLKSGTHQVWRMDHHSFHGPKTGSSSFAGKGEISVWYDDNYHFHVSKPPN